MMSGSQEDTAGELKVLFCLFLCILILVGISFIAPSEMVHLV